MKASQLYLSTREGASTHTFITQLKQVEGIDYVMLKKVVGHTAEGETLGRYGKKFGPDLVLERLVKRLRYEGLELDGVKDSKHSENRTGQLVKKSGNR